MPHTWLLPFHLPLRPFITPRSRPEARPVSPRDWTSPFSSSAVALCCHRPHKGHVTVALGLSFLACEMGHKGLAPACCGVPEQHRRSLNKAIFWLLRAGPPWTPPSGSHPQSQSPPQRSCRVWVSQHPRSALFDFPKQTAWVGCRGPIPALPPHSPTALRNTSIPAPCPGAGCAELRVRRPPPAPPSKPYSSLQPRHPSSQGCAGSQVRACSLRPGRLARSCAWRCRVPMAWPSPLSPAKTLVPACEEGAWVWWRHGLGPLLPRPASVSPSLKHRRWGHWLSTH